MSTNIRYARNGAVEIAYETFGDVDRGEPLLLVMGLDFQMVWWPDDLIAKFVEAGFAVVRFDNRDTGLSTSFGSISKPSVWKGLTGRSTPAYTTADMLADIDAVLDAVGWHSTHLLGGSMGAGIAQDYALERAGRVRSLTCCMGIPADAGVLGTLRYIRPGVFRTLARIDVGDTPESQAEALAGIYRAVASPGFPFPEEWARETAREAIARAPYDHAITQRQLAAGRAHDHGDIAAIAAPTLVISGRDDPLIRWKAGREIASRIRGARFRAFPGMGHNIPAELFDTVVSEVVDLTRRAQ